LGPPFVPPFPSQVEFALITTGVREEENLTLDCQNVAIPAAGRE
jgi:hypothetical protein